MKALIALVSLSFVAATSVASYPKSFMWGAAFSAHQTEGSIEGGGTNSDWYAFEHGSKNGKPNIKNGQNTDVAIDHWNRFDEDIEWGAKLGLDTIRTSVAWEKIEPEPGRFSRPVIEHYKNVFAKMKARGIKPMIALHHFVHPKWFHEKGGWTHNESPKWFLEYADFVVRELGPYCDLWITFNEPVLQVAFGFIAGKTPPFKHNPWKAFDAAWNIARAHRMVAHRIHELQGVPANARDSAGRLRGVGLAQSTQIFDPADPSSDADRKVAQEIEELVDWSFLRSIESGRLQLRFPKSLVSTILGMIDRPFPSNDFTRIAGEPMQDWIGINYYSRYVLKASRWSPLGFTWLAPSGQLGDNGWEIFPRGLERLLKTAAQFKRPLVVTENGLADAEDDRRPKFIADHLAEVDHALAEGIDVRGYYFWSLFDNFEWLEGYGKRFGLIEIKYDENLKRVPRGSYDKYKSEIQLRK